MLPLPESVSYKKFHPSVPCASDVNRKRNVTAEKTCRTIILLLLKNVRVYLYLWGKAWQETKKLSHPSSSFVTLPHLIQKVKKNFTIFSLKVGGGHKNLSPNPHYWRFQCYKWHFLRFWDGLKSAGQNQI
jgi:hypothetical protein